MGERDEIWIDTKRKKIQREEPIGGNHRNRRRAEESLIQKRPLRDEFLHSGTLFYNNMFMLKSIQSFDRAAVDLWNNTRPRPKWATSLANMCEQEAQKYLQDPHLPRPPHWTMELFLWNNFLGIYGEVQETEMAHHVERRGP